MHADLVCLHSATSMNRCPKCSLLFNAGYALPTNPSQASSFRPRVSSVQRRRRQHFGEAVGKNSVQAQSVRHCVPHARAKDEPPRPRHDWEGLIQEFENRAHVTEFASHPPPPGVPLDEEDPEQFEMLPVVESAACTALTFMFWNLGKIWRLDSFLLLFYPIPMFFITMRWGPKVGDVVLFTTLFSILTMMGPLYCILYFLNTGIMAMVFSRALYHRWHWLPGVLAGGVAKGVGLALQFTWMSGIIRYNSWTMIAEQVKIMVESIMRAGYAIARAKSPPVLALGHVQVAIGVVLVLHSILHVLFTYLTSTMLLDRIGDDIKLKRKPRMLRILVKLKENAMRQRRRY